MPDVDLAEIMPARLPATSSFITSEKNISDGPLLRHLLVLLEYLLHFSVLARDSPSSKIVPQMKLIQLGLVLASLELFLQTDTCCQEM